MYTVSLYNLCGLYKCNLSKSVLKKVQLFSLMTKDEQNDIGKTEVVVIYA